MKPRIKQRKLNESEAAQPTEEQVNAAFEAVLKQEAQKFPKFAKAAGLMLPLIIRGGDGSVKLQFYLNNGKQVAAAKKYRQQTCRIALDRH